jgi:hypothetical protein
MAGIKNDLNIKGAFLRDEFLHQTAEYLHHHFNIHHTTIQLEQSDISDACHFSVSTFPSPSLTGP